MARQRLHRINQRVRVLIEKSTGCSRNKGWEKEKTTLHYEECAHDLLKEKADTLQVFKGRKNRVSKERFTSNQSEKRGGWTYYTHDKS